MIELPEAISLIERAATPLPPRRLPLLEACGRVLAAGIVSDVDSPPWDRAMMDGFAVRSEDFSAGVPEIVELDVAVDLAAGDVTTLAIGRGACGRIMTGAPIPAGADAVVPVESAVDGTASVHAGGRVRLRDERFRVGQHIARQGAAFRRGQEVLSAGMALGSAEIGLAAEAGATHVLVPPRVRVAIVSTGSELVPIPLGIAADRPEAIRAAVAQGLAADVLVLSGGVSAGDLDLVPEIFRQCGVEKIFHKVRLKPGKPVWFGILRRENAAPTIVFGLPGNPASSLVCFELFARPVIAILAGEPRETWHLPRRVARLTAPAKAAADRPVYLPCRLAASDGGLAATPLPWSGSSDLLGLAGAAGLLALPAGGRLYEAGEEVEVVLRS